MIPAILNLFFIFSALIITAYLIRHYIFTIVVLRSIRKPKLSSIQSATLYEPKISILIPAHNEENVIGAMLQKMTELDYPFSKLEVFAIDDASTDKTGIIVTEYAKKYKFIKAFIRGKATGGRGKPAALNEALNYATGEIVVLFDADYLPQSQVVRKLIEKFVDSQVGAVQGRPVVLNEPQTLVTRLNALERTGGYKVDQQARELLGLIPQYGGTVGAFRRRLILKLGGFDESILTEDTDLTFMIALAGYRVSYNDDVECYEETVASWSTYWRQRQRWAKGHMQVCIKHFFRVVRSKRLTLIQKLDGLLLLNIYFMPILTLIALLTGVYLIATTSLISSVLWLVVPISIYSFVGNYAPFFEIGIGAYLDGRKQIQWLAPLLIFSFLFNTIICTKALFSLICDKILRRQSLWVKTEHLGNSNKSC
jgi:cellulose synthase/poly-beta-1,6-N-acetylglucosamine synthase-like glycosyltransferase